MRDWLTYPGLTYQPFGNSMALTWARQPAIILIHSTEGGSYPAYGGGKSNPHFTANLLARTCRQHTPLTRASRALVAPAGVHTNTGGVIQIEVIGSCVVGTPYVSVLKFNDEELAYLAGLVRLIAQETGTPLVETVRWVAYPASYANKQGQRLTVAEWNYYRGILGHQHVPGNVHGDPGSMNITRMLELANGNSPTPVPPDIPVVEDDMFEQADRDAVAAALAAATAASNNATAALRQAASTTAQVQEATRLLSVAVDLIARNSSVDRQEAAALVRQVADVKDRMPLATRRTYEGITTPTYDDLALFSSYYEISGVRDPLAAQVNVQVDEKVLVAAVVSALPTAEEIAKATNDDNYNRMKE